MCKSIFQILALLLISQISIAQSDTSILENDSDTISMELSKHNNIIIRATLNDIDTLRLMLHTAVNDVSLTKKATSKMHSIKFSSADSVESWGGKTQSRFSEKNSLSIGPFNWSNIGIWESEHSGHNTDGKFGLNLFHKKIVELNFEKGYLVIHSRLPEKVENYDKLNINDVNGLMFIEGECKIGKEVYANKFLIHSGYSGSILLDDQFVSQNGISGKLTAINKSTLKDSYGNELTTINAILPNFKLGDIEFSDVPVGFFEGSINRQKISVIGGDIIKRFNIIFDFKNSVIYLRPNQLLEVAYSSN